MTGRFRYWFVPAVFGVAILWAYWTTIAEMAERWTDDPQYSHGYLVPLFSAFLLWFRREKLREVRPVPNWWGVAILILGVALWSVGTYFFLNWFAAVSLLCALAGLAVVAGGWPALRWSWQAVLFLGFMIPLPYRLQTALGGALQTIATKLSTYALLTFGAPAISEGNVILLNDVKIGIVEACSGLGMLVTFVALATAVALLMRSSELWLRIAVVLSALPVAVLANVTRITVTGLLFNAAQDHLAQVVFHDVAGWLMMPLALLMLFAEVYVLKRLIIDRPARRLGTGGLPGLAFAKKPTPAIR
jgi:exosortase